MKSMMKMKNYLHMKTYRELGYRDIDEVYSENRDSNPHHFHYYDSGKITYKKKYIHLYLLTVEVKL